MPAILAHHLFGEDASSLLPPDVLSNQEEVVAFLLGSQGPDPLSARFTGAPRAVRTCRTLSDSFHSGRMVDAFCVMHSTIARLSTEDQALGTAIMLGFAAHYLLDSMTNPLILAQVEELRDARNDLTDAKTELKMLIESDVDTWLLWQKRQKTIVEAPATAMLASTPRIRHIAGTLTACVARDVYGFDLDAHEYGRAVYDYRLTYRLIDPPAKLLPSALAHMESLWHAYPHVNARRHLVTQSDECASANLHRHTWNNPYTGEASTASFADLFHDALLAWPVFASRIAAGDQRRIAAMVGDINYYGKPC